MTDMTDEDKLAWILASEELAADLKAERALADDLADLLIHLHSSGGTIEQVLARYWEARHQTGSGVKR